MHKAQIIGIEGAAQVQLPLASNPTLPSPPEQPCAWQRSHAPPCDWGLERAWVQTLVGDLSKTLDGGRAS